MIKKYYERMTCRFPFFFVKNEIKVKVKFATNMCEIVFGLKTTDFA